MDAHETETVEEIDVYQYWLVIERRWKLILILFLVPVVLASIATMYMARTYRVTAVINQGRVVGGELNERIASVATLADIQQIIASGSLVKPILSSLNLKEDKYGLSLGGNLSLEAKENSENILIRFDTADPELGVKILARLISEIQRTFNQRADNYRQFQKAGIAKAEAAIKLLQVDREKGNLEIQKLTQEITKKERLAQINTTLFTNERTSTTNQINSLTERIKGIMAIKDRLTAVSAKLEPNTLDLANAKSQLTGNAGKDNVLVSILYANTVQQNLNFLTLYYDMIRKFEVEARDYEERIVRLKNDLSTMDERIKEVAVTKEAEVKDLQTKIAETKLQIDKFIPSEIEKISSEVEALKVRMNMIEGIKVVAAPDFANVPIGPKRRVIVSAVAAASLVASILLAFLLEWRKGNEERLAQARKAAHISNLAS